MSNPSIKVLVVEDEGIIAEDVRGTLLRLGYSVADVVASGERGLLSAQKHRPTLVLADIRLRGTMDGIDMASCLRSTLGIPVIFLTSHSDESTLARATATDPYGFLVKPFTDRELHTAIEVALHRHRLEMKLRATLAQLEEKSAMLAVVIDSMGDAVVATDVDGKVLMANDAGKKLLGETGFSESGTSDLYQDDGVTLCTPSESPLARTFRGEVLKQAQHRLVSGEHPDGIWLSTSAAPVRDPQGKILGGVMVARDVTSLKRIEKELEHRSIVDELTGLYNRRGFTTIAGQQLKLAERLGSTPALIFADLNGMKGINDNLGHAEGDRALKDAADVLRTAFRKSDLVSRLGGDEFVVLAPDASPDSSAKLLSRVREVLAEHNARGDRPYKLSMSAGVCYYDPHAPETIEALIDRADQLMYVQKQHRRDTGANDLSTTTTDLDRLAG
jgi:diguanylate cyclase (GGDEF)-like protein/PAS domain S-box-containing protein